MLIQHFRFVGRGYVIAPRDCPLCFGQAPENTFMCMNDVSISALLLPNSGHLLCSLSLHLGNCNRNTQFLFSHIVVVVFIEKKEKKQIYRLMNIELLAQNKNKLEVRHSLLWF